MHGREQANSGDGDGGGERILGTQDAVEKDAKAYTAQRGEAQNGKVAEFGVRSTACGRRWRPERRGSKSRDKANAKCARDGEDAQQPAIFIRMIFSSQANRAENTNSNSIKHIEGLGQRCKDAGIWTAATIKNKGTQQHCLNSPRQGGEKHCDGGSNTKNREKPKARKRKP